MTIKNIVFDLGNVLIKWDPYEVIQKVLPERDPKEIYQQMRDVWIDLNLGKVAEKEAIKLYQQQINVSESHMINFMNELKKHQTLIPGSLELLKKLDSLKFNLYSITDNIKEFIAYHRMHSNFIHYFKDVVVSADLGILKPNPKIYKYLLDKHKLIPQETVFIDDIMENVQGAVLLGMHSFQFINAEDCKWKLIKLGVNL